MHKDYVSASNLNSFNSITKMAVSVLLNVLILLFFIQPFFSHAHNHHHFNGTKPKPSEFMKHLQGCHKGDTHVKGLNDIKKYLNRFGYLNHHGHNDDFDDSLESAVKTYQTYYHLNITGSLDSETIAQMMKPRCAVPDIINGTTSKQPGHKRKHPRRLTGIHFVSHYSFFNGNPRWPASKTHLTYAFRQGVRLELMSPICARAFNRWSQVTHFTFQQISSFQEADIKIGFYRGNHGEGQAFDGPGGTLAQAYAPPDGRFQFDADTNWSVGAVTGAFDLETIAIHEIGHLLGLHHSEVQDAIMYAYAPSGTQKLNLHSDDIQGIRALYNL